MDDAKIIRTIALPEFVKKYSDLIDENAEWTEFEVYLIQSIYEIRFIANYSESEHNTIDRTARITYKIICNGAIKSFEEVLKSYLFNIERLQQSLNYLWEAKTEILNGKNNDTKIKRLLSFYKELYERLMPVLFAPILVSLWLSSKKKSFQYKIDQEGKASLAQLKKIQYDWTAQRKQLALGLNEHLRNAYSHENYRINDDGSVEIWDIDPRTGKYSKYPETYTFEQIKAESEDLWKNAIGIINAWILFAINNRKIIDKIRSTNDIPIAFNPLRINDIQNIIEFVATKRGFLLNYFHYEKKELILELCTLPKGIDQNEIVTGFHNKNIRNYSIAVQYCEYRIIEQLLGMLQIISYQIRENFLFTISIISYEKKYKAEIKGHTELFEKYAGKDLPPIEEFRKKLDIDTVGDANMWIRKESLVKC